MQAMDSITVIKGYGKLENLEEQSSLPNPNPKPTHKRRLIVTAAVSAIVVLTLILCSLVAALVHESRSESEPDSSDSIRAVCAVTRHPSSCSSTISSMHPSASDPELLFLLSLRAAIANLSELSALPQKLRSKVNDPRSESALRDCGELFDDALSRLNDSASAMAAAAGEEKPLLTERKIGDLKAWIAAAMTDQETCADGMEEMGSTLADEVRAAVQRSEVHLSNSLAILANMQTLLNKFGLTLH